MHNDECCTGQKWGVHAHTHANASCAWFDHSHTRPKACRAPFGWGSTIGKQNAVRTILGRLVSQDADNARMGNGVSAFGRALRAPVQAFGRHSVPQCRQVPAYGRALRAPVPAFGRHSVPPMQASAGLRAFGRQSVVRAPSADQCRPCFRVPNAPSHRVHVQASASLPLPA